MAQTLEALLHRTETLASIRGIVHTMKTLSVLNAVPYDHAARAIEAFHDTVLDGLAAFFHRTGATPPDLPRSGAEVIVVFGSDHGMCGSYNTTLAARLARQLDETGATRRAASQILCIGAQMQDALIAQGLVPREVLLTPASVDGVGRLSGIIVGWLDQARQRVAADDLAVSLAYTRRAPHGRQDPVIESFLPLSGDLIRQLAGRPWPSRSLPDFSLPPDRLFAILIRNHIFSGLFRASTEALVTENAARLATMHQAEQAIDERLEELRGETRTVRQAEITAELLDVVIGFEALAGRR